MRGLRDLQTTMLAVVDLEERVPPNHPLRVIKQFADRALVVIPAAVFWEIALLLEHDRIKVREPFEEWAAAVVARKGIDMAALDLDVIAEAHHLRFNGDPFDRTIVATAKLMDLPLITKDQLIVNANLVEIAW